MTHRPHLHLVDTAPLQRDDVVSIFPPTAAEAATDVGLDLDGDGSRWYPAPPGTLARPLAYVAALIAAAVGLIWGPDWGPWIVAQWAAR